MKALVIYESMFGNTRKVAEAIARGLAPLGDVSALHVGDAGPEVVAAADLVVIGCPTHAHGMSRPKSRAGAAAMARRHRGHLDLEPGAQGPGVREWLDALPRTGAHARAAAFDTRMTMSPLLTGRASRRAHRRLRHLGFTMVARPQSFLVDGANHLVAGEEGRAVAWGTRLAAEVHDRPVTVA